MPNRNTERLADELKQIDHSLEIEIWPDIKNPDTVEFAVVWYHPQNELLKFPNLKAISSYGAGVDHILSDSGLPAQVPFARIVAPTLVEEMNEYVLTAILNHKRRFTDFKLQQSNRLWKPYSKRNGINVGIMGLGQLGSALAQYLLNFGFIVKGWSQSKKLIKNVACYDKQSLDDFLIDLDYLVCLLPLTNETEHILNTDLFKRCHNKPYLINVARGKHLNESDLIAALNFGQISGVCLDVFVEEPLPANHPFWQDERILITPHVAAVTDVSEAAQQIVENYRRMRQSQPLINEVNREKGY